jgi:hypothetical protein
MHAVDTFRVVGLFQKTVLHLTAMALTQPTVGRIHSSLRTPTSPLARR